MIGTSTLSPVYFLLVDDLEENLLALEGLLRRPDLVLLKALNGTEALELLLKYDIALALVDVQMPVMDGFELAELMRGTERTRRVPIIFLTAGSADLQRRFRGYEAGAVDFLQKPIEPDVLRSKADVFFELYRQRQEVARQRDDLELAADRIGQLLSESQRQSAALREADQRKDEFLAMLAHELRNPLAPIRSATDLLRLIPMESLDLQSAREIIARQVAHMVRLIDDLLDVARIARGKVELQRAPLDIGKLTARAAEDLRQPLEMKGLTLKLDVTDRPLIVDGDSVRLAQVIGNLLQNASKFTPAGGTVTVRVAPSVDGTLAEISVRDTGIGIPTAMLERLFEPFYQASQTIDRKHGGLGLGLSLARGMVELHQGTINAISGGTDHGATFTVRIPLIPSTVELPATPAKSIPAPRAHLHVLVIDDHKDAAESLQRLIARLGHDVQIALDGTSGLEQIRRHRPDVVISDLGLPGEINGYQVAESIRRSLGLTELFLIALSGYGQESDRQKALASGFDLFLVKPVESHTLAAILETRSQG